MFCCFAAAAERTRQQLTRQPNSHSHITSMLAISPCTRKFSSWLYFQPHPNGVPPAMHQSTPTFNVCLVCSDWAKGLHYGITSCEGCKSFFKRSITGKHVYECKKEKSCQLTPLNRTKCQYCRLKKCLDQGMNRKGKCTVNTL